MSTEKASKRGFASMTSEKQKEIARKGGRAAHERGTAHEFTADEARAAGRKGGEAVSANRTHMAAIGRLGGKSSAGRRAAKQEPGGSHSGESSASSPSHAQENGHTHHGAHPAGVHREDRDAVVNDIETSTESTAESEDAGERSTAHSGAA